MRLAFCVLTIGLAGLPLSGQEPATPQWSRFRGPNGSGVSDRDKPPTTFGPTTNRIWQSPAPSGHSSPSIWRESGVPHRRRRRRPGTDRVPAPRWHAALAAARAGGAPREGPHVQQPGCLHAGHRRRARLRVPRLVPAAGLRLRGQGTLAEAAPGAAYRVRLRDVADRLRRQGHPPARWQRRRLRTDGVRPADRRRDLAHAATVAG